MVTGPLVNDQIKAAVPVISKFNENFRVKAAFWLKERESDGWFLYLASDDISDSNFDQAYRRLLEIVSPARNRWIDPFQVKVVGTGSPIAKAALDVMQEESSRLPTVYRGNRFGDVSVDEVYLYSIPPKHR